MIRNYFLLILLLPFSSTFLYTQTDADSSEEYLNNEKINGYRGIWFTLGQTERMIELGYDGKYGDKYSAGKSFAWSHTVAPMAIYAPEVNKTFFVWGGTTGPKNTHLLAMASYYDHSKHLVPRPTVVRDQRGIDDPHDNPSITIDDDGYIWIFIAGRGRHRPGQIFKSLEPYSVDNFEMIIEREQTYSQIRHVSGKGFMHLLTLYTSGRELYFETSIDGSDWTKNPANDLQKIAGFGGHYQVSRYNDLTETLGSAFNYHPGGTWNGIPVSGPDSRTNIYYIKTNDFGKTWTTVDGKELELPLDSRDNPALVIDYESQGKMAYVNKLEYDSDGNPVILVITSPGYLPGPVNDPRIWEIVRWTGEEWVTHEITRSDHNYDAGSLYINGDRWTVIGPTITGPQAYYTGGEIGLWVSYDKGETWRLEQEVTQNSKRNHSYVRRPDNPVDPFFAIWADGNSKEFSISHLYFSNSNGTKVYKLPYYMTSDFAEPIEVDMKNFSEK
mgnify:CR=1 FL=1